MTTSAEYEERARNLLRGANEVPTAISAVAVAILALVEEVRTLRERLEQV